MQGYPPRVLLALLSACAPAREGGVREAGREVGDTATEGEDSGETAAETASETAAETASDTADSGPAGPCPPEMALVGAFCIDRWEGTLAGWSPFEVPTAGVAQSVAGAPPQGYISAEVASDACRAAGKRLCAPDEWLLACSGGERTYPYGDTYDPAACNTSYDGDHPVCDYFGTCDGVWDMEHMNDPGINQQPGTVDATGANPGCVTPEGVYDLHGNLHEWIADADGTFKGGFYADASINGAGCAYTTTAHEPSYHDYSTGFRCCAEAE